MDDSKEPVFQAQQDKCHVNSQRLWPACTNPTRVQARQGLSTEGGRRHGVFIFNTLWQLEKTTFSNGLSLGLSAHTPGQALCPGVFSQHTTNSMVFYFGLVWFFSLIGLLVFGFVFVLKIETDKNIKLGG